MTRGRTPFVACGPFLLVLALSACSERTTPSAEENRQLENAAEMLDSAPDALANIDENSLGSPDSNLEEPQSASR